MLRAPPTWLKKHPCKPESSEVPISVKHINSVTGYKRPETYTSPNIYRHPTGNILHCYENIYLILSRYPTVKLLLLSIVLYTQTYLIAGLNRQTDHATVNKGHERT